MGRKESNQINYKAHQTSPKTTLKTAILVLSTGQSLYVDISYLKYTAYVKVIIHPRTLPLYCIVFQTYIELSYFKHLTIKKWFFIPRK